MKPAAQTILRWLRDNGIPLGALTSTDTRCLFAAVHIADLWLNTSEREATAEAFARIVNQMQPHTRYLAYHAIAHVGDWCHRGALWTEAALSTDDLLNKPQCKFAPKREPARPLLPRFGGDFRITGE